VEDSVAWMASHGVHIPHADHDIIKARLGKGKVGTEAAAKRSASHLGKGKGKEKDTQDKSTKAKHPGLSLGPQAVLNVQVWSEGWVLVTHGGAYTQCHHDAEGLATYIVANCRVKIWVPTCPNPNASIRTR
jgi:hypothetical protein